MKTAILYLNFLFASLTGFSQTKLFDKFDFDSTYKIVAVCSPFDPSRQYQHLTFIISDLKKLNIVKNTIAHGEKPPQPIYGEDGLNVYVIRDKEIIKTYEVSPKYGHVSYHPTDSTHGIFKFDIFQLQQLAGSKPIKYRIENYTFKSQEESKQFITKNKYAKGFIGYEEITQEKEGTFSVAIPKSVNIQTIKDAQAFINTELLRITSNKKEYLCGFLMTNSGSTKFVYEINSSKDFYNQFSLSGCEKSSWKENQIEISTIWLK